MIVIENLTHILVFKTNIKSRKDKTSIAKLLKGNTDIEEWSVDCDDIDCVLRVVSYKLSAGDVINLIHQNGFYCEELND